MFKQQKFKSWIGYNQNKYILLLILVTGIAFPFIFLQDTLSGYIKFGFLNPIIGIVYASILVIGNLTIFYKLKLKLIHNNGLAQNNYLLKHFTIHMMFTLLASFLMASLPFWFLGSSVSLGYIARNLIGSCLLISILVGFYEALYYINAFKKSIKRQEELKRENVESQLEILKNQVKPHFLFNSLNTLASIIPDDPDQAVAYVQNLSSMYRYVLEIKDKKLIPLSEELACVKAYLFMMKIRFGENLIIDIEDSANDENKHIVPLSLQLLLENAIKHNIISNKKPLTIKISEANGHIQVHNNLQIKLQDQPSTGIGLNNIRSRYKIIADKKVVVIENENEFLVNIPLIDVY
jgi:sensor histidine kinase YesM